MRETDSTPVHGVRVEAVAGSRRYSDTTKMKGEFGMKVPAGQYVVRAIDPGFSFAADPLTYENPNKTIVDRGGCAQIQFVGVERPEPPPLRKDK